MNITFVYYSLRAGGAERSIAMLANYFAETGHSVSIVTCDEQYSFYHINNMVKHITLGHTKNSKNIFEAVINNLNLIYKLHILYKKISPDVVIPFALNYVLLSFCAKIFCQYKIISSVRTNPQLIKNGFWGNSGRVISRLCDGMVFQTKNVQMFYPLSVQKKSIILQNAIHSECLAQKNVWATRHDICAVGRMDKDKCFSDILLAFATIHKHYPEVILDLYGDGPLRSSLESETLALGLGDVVCFHGQTQNIFEVYASHKFFIMASQREGFPNVLLEAMASGCACVSSNCDFGPSELIRDGENGYLVPVHNPALMAERICMLIEDDSLCAKIAQEATLVKTTNSLENIGKQFYKFIQTVCSK